MDATEQMLKDFTEAHGTSGHEGSARSIMKQYLENYHFVSRPVELQNMRLPLLSVVQIKHFDKSQVSQLE